MQDPPISWIFKEWVGYPPTPRTGGIQPTPYEATQPYLTTPDHLRNDRELTA